VEAVAVAFALSTFVSTLLGGLVALRNRDRLHLVLGFTAGVLLGVVAFDLLPEIFKLSDDGGRGVPAVMLAFAAGFIVLHLLERTVALHGAHESDYGEHNHPAVGLASALALSAHSFMDGVGIGLGFQAGPAVGVTVAIAVIAHDFADGLNTVSIMLSHRNSTGRSLALLGLDAVAPVLGAAATLLFTVPDHLLGLYLGFFAGFLLYLATGDILPEAHSRHPSRLTLVATLVGITAMWGVVSAS
jgi:zinc and cadmium transporter